jgi:hypothetical protein
MKIHHVTDNSGAIHLVRAHTTAGARKFVAAKLGQNMTAKVPTQDELVSALQSGIAIEDARPGLDYLEGKTVTIHATAPAASGGTNSDDQEPSP